MLDVGCCNTTACGSTRVPQEVTMTRTNHTGPRSKNLLLAVALTLVVAQVGAPAERVVLGEYFTNLY
jgi:hypothetical protein